MAGTSCDAGCACETASESAAGVGVSATWSECNSEIRGHCAADSFVYHMGTASKDGRTVTSGGRVLFVVGRGDDLREARANALRRVAAIECDNLFYRKDIGWQAT